MVLLAAAALAADPIADAEAAWQAIYDRAAPAVVAVKTAHGLGSGILLRADGLVLTNAHVVEGQDTVEIVRVDGSRSTGKVIERANGIDLALIDAEGEGLPTLRFGRDLRVGSWVSAIGHGAGGGWTFAQGMVTNIYAVGGDRPVFQTQIPVNPGNSGGPVLDRHGAVVGVVTASMPGMESINFAIKSETVVRSLRGLSDMCDCVAITAPKGVPVFVDGKNVGLGPNLTATVAAGTHVIFAVIGGKRVERTVHFPEQRSVDLTTP